MVLSKSLLGSRNSFLIIFGVIVLVNGILSILFPSIMTRKEMRDNPSMLERTKKNGIKLVLSGLGLIAIGYISNMIG